MRITTIQAMENRYKICRICLKPADIKITRQQQHAVVMEGTHEDGTVHSWLKYDSMLLNTRKRGEKPDRIKCPRCGKIGIVNQFRPDARDPLKTAYVVVHEKIAGLWSKGTPKEMQKRRRCFIRDEKGMEEIDKKLHRYVPPSK